MPTTFPEDALRTTDPMERLIESALIDARIPYLTDMGGEVESALDFYLPAHEVHIEVKRFHTPRVGAQMSRAQDVIVAQGERAVRLLAEAIRSGRLSPRGEAVINGTPAEERA
jgi:hypothetical protein